MLNKRVVVIMIYINKCYLIIYFFCLDKANKFKLNIKMKQVKTTLQLTSYLDVSEYILKEHSPLIKPSSPQLHHQL